MTDAEALERGYRRLLALYPRSYRREHEEELLTVLLACAGEGRRRPEPADAANLIRNALWMRLRPGAPRSARTVFVAVRLMYAGAVLQLLSVVTLLLTLDSIRSGIRRADPGFTAAQWHTVVVAHVIPDVIGAPIAAGVWVWLAWANGRGHRWGRVGLAVFLALTSLGLLVDVAQDATVFAPASMAVAGAMWLAGIVAVVLVFHVESGAHYARPGRRRAIG
jgi:hypothetical protein